MKIHFTDVILLRFNNLFRLLSCLFFSKSITEIILFDGARLDIIFKKYTNRDEKSCLETTSTHDEVPIKIHAEVKHF